MANESNELPSDPNDKEDKLNINRILEEEIGEGWYQVKAVVLCGLIAFFFGLKESDFLFFAERIKTRCKIHECERNDQFSFTPPWLTNAVPSFEHTFDKCHRYAPSDSWNSTIDSCSRDWFNRSSIITCTEYVYEHQNSAVYEFGLACDEWRWWFFGSSQLIGAMVSLPLGGYVSDRWGRRVALSITSFNMALIGIARYWANSYTTFILIGLLASVLGSACISCTMILALELVSSKRRMATGSTVFTFLSTGVAVKGLVASTQPYWRDIILMLYLPMLISISYFWIAPESVRWLISKQRFEESKTILIKAAKMNGREFSENTLKKLSENISTSKDEARVSEANLICLLFKFRTMLLRCVVISIWLISTSFIIRGLAYSSVSISGNKYVNYSAVSVAAIPGYWISTFLINKIGRKPLLFGVFWIAGFCQLGYIFVPKDFNGANLVLYLVSNLCAAVAQNSIIVYSAELYPTSHRTRLYAISTTFGKFGGLAALITPALADRVRVHLPHTLFAVTSLVSGLLVLLTPETLGLPLPETMEDALKLGKDQRSWLRELLRKLTVKNYVCRDDGVVGKISVISN